VLCRHDDVGGQRDLEATTEREAAYRGNDRLPKIKPRAGATKIARRELRCAVSGGPLEIGTCQERSVPGARNYGGPHFLIGGNAVPRRSEVLVGRRMQGIHDPGTVDRDRCDVLSFLVTGEFEVHE